MNEIFASIAEAKIREAIEKGELNNLPGKGKPVTIESMLFVPPDERLAFSIMKNSGIEPVEVALKREIEEIRQSVTMCSDESEREKLEKKLRETSIRYGVLMEKRRIRK